MSSLLLTNSDLHRVSADLTSQQLYVPLESGAEEQRLHVSRQSSAAWRKMLCVPRIGCALACRQGPH